MDGEHQDVKGGAGRRWSPAVWQGFNRWRKKYWRTRVLILLLIFGPTIFPVLARRALIVELVRIACTAIQLSHEPSHAWALARYYRAQEVRRLQIMLRLEIDRDRSGSLEPAEEARAAASGLDPGQLNEHVLRADLGQLVLAARHFGLVTSSYSEREVRRRAWNTAVGENLRFYGPDHRKIDSLLAASYAWPDYTRWDTWKRGIYNFIGHFLWLFGPGRAGSSWLLVCLFGAGTASLALKRCRPQGGFAVGVLLVVVPFLLRSSAFYDQYQYEWLHWLGLGLLGGVAGYAGGKAAMGVKRRARGALIGTLLLGLAVAASGALAAIRMSRWLRCFCDPYSLAGDYTAVSLVCAGLALMGAGTAGLCVARWKRQRQNAAP
ncbi:MAG: hypothetical protein KAX19_14545 [Candidatus Brocadiae bacterium]|nr:hypothetical protein [Candidatus Brocadiia bacterium]